MSSTPTYQWASDTRRSGEDSTFSTSARVEGVSSGSKSSDHKWDLKFHEIGTHFRKFLKGLFALLVERKSKKQSRSEREAHAVKENLTKEGALKHILMGYMELQMKMERLERVCKKIDGDMAMLSEMKKSLCQTESDDTLGRACIVRKSFSTTLSLSIANNDSPGTLSVRPNKGDNEDIERDCHTYITNKEHILEPGDAPSMLSSNAMSSPSMLKDKIDSLKRRIQTRLSPLKLYSSQKHENELSSAQKPRLLHLQETLTRIGMPMKEQNFLIELLAESRTCPEDNRCAGDGRGVVDQGDILAANYTKSVLATSTSGKSAKTTTTVISRDTLLHRRSKEGNPHSHASKQCKISNP